MDLVERLPLPGAEARLLRDGIGWRFEFEEAGNVYADRYDPRDDDGTLVVAPTRWTTPDGVEITPSTHDAIIDAFWALAQKTQDVARILEWRPELGCNVARRWTLGASGFLVRVAAYGAASLEYLELDRTAWIPFTREDDRVVRIDEARAAWRFPNAALDPADAARIAGRVRNAAPSDMVLSEASWKIL